MTEEKTLKLKRRSVLATIPAVGAAALTRRTRAAGGSDVRFAYFGDPAEKEAYEILINAFRKRFPSISIDAIPVASLNVPIDRGLMPSGGYPEWLRWSFSSDAPPDVFMLGYRDVGRYATQGKIEPIGPYLRGSNVFGADDFYPQALDAFRARKHLGEDDLAAIPQNLSSLVVFYNTAMFDDMGIKRPSEGWTWDEFSAAASALTMDRDGDGVTNIHGLAMDPTITRYAPFIWGAGGDLVDDVNLPTKLTLDTPKSLAGIKWLTSLGKAGLNVTPTEAETRLLDDTRRFRSGRAGMLIQSRRVVTFLRQNGSLEWDVAPLPTGLVPANVLHSDGLAIASGARNKDAAWTFIEFVMGPVGQSILAESGRIVPSLRAIAESDSFLKGTALADRIGFGFRPASANVFLNNIDISRRLPSEMSWGTVVHECDAAFKQAFYGDGNAEAAIKRIYEQTGPAFTDVKSVYQRLNQMGMPSPVTED